eukprot:TRINITY_DN70071_c0_g1_i1.p1 TRINITY_DN70071_c0_g1~~TRINITY_DN70071_c0_g1_i1.p1  ORF type:complete len:414 (+),score=44.90 TRINITY_DN70071_c0_g1_i1:137-1378(+)
MAFNAHRRLHVLASAVLGTAVVTKLRTVSTSSKDDGPWRSSYIRRGMTDAGVIADRSVMNKLYVNDIHRLQSVVPSCPEHVSLTRQPSYTKGGRAQLRILTWNINMLCGPDGSASVGSLKRIDPDLIAEVIERVNPDIVCLQESIDWMPPKYRQHFEKHGVADLDVRMRRLNDRLRQQGFGYLRRSCAPPSTGSPNLLATRLSVMHEETFDLAPELARAFEGTTARNAGYVEVKLSESGQSTLGVYNTHLHHIDNVPQEGRRAAEIETLLRHVSARKKITDRVATVVTGDFNEAREQDLTPVEWTVVAAAKVKLRQKPQDDRVAATLRSAGFVCTYDASPPLSNFGGRAAPAFTHWTGTTVDYAYLLDETPSHQVGPGTRTPRAAVKGAYVVFSDLSDHLPIVTDLSIELPVA